MDRHSFSVVLGLGPLVPAKRSEVWFTRLCKMAEMCPLKEHQPDSLSQCCWDFFRPVADITMNSWSAGGVKRILYYFVLAPIADP